MSDNKYKLFRNFMVNELGISRDDIKEWTMQTVAETVEKVLRGIDVEKLVYEKAYYELNKITTYTNLRQNYMSTLNKMLKERLDIQINLKPEKEATDESFDLVDKILKDYPGEPLTKDEVDKLLKNKETKK